MTWREGLAPVTTPLRSPTTTTPLPTTMAFLLLQVARRAVRPNYNLAFFAGCSAARDVLKLTVSEQTTMPSRTRS